MNFTAFGQQSGQNNSSPLPPASAAHFNANGSSSQQNGAHSHVNGNGNESSNGNGTNANGSTKGHNRFTGFCATISSGVSIKGTVKFRSELVMDGEFEGTIDSVGRLTVGRNGRVRGDIRTRSVTVHGTVDGKLSVDDKCELRSGCTLRGDIETARLVVDENVNFIGNAAIALRDYLAELRMPNGNGTHPTNGNGSNGSHNGNGNGNHNGSGDLSGNGHHNGHEAP